MCAFFIWIVQIELNRRGVRLNFVGFHTNEGERKCTNVNPAPSLKGLGVEGWGVGSSILLREPLRVFGRTL